MAVLLPSLEYGYEVRNTNKCQAKALESIQLCACVADATSTGSILPRIAYN